MSHNTSYGGGSSAAIAALTDFEDSITATGANQGAAYAITKHVNRVTGGSGSGVRLPASVAGNPPIIVLNNSAANPGAGLSSAINVYPNTSETILPLTQNTRDYLSGNMGAVYHPQATGYWRAEPFDMKSDHLSRTNGDTQYFYGTLYALNGADISGGAFNSSSTLTQSANAQFTKNVGFAVTSTSTGGTTLTLNWNNCIYHKIDLQGASGDVTLTLSNPIQGAEYVVEVTQGSVARNLIWPATVKWPGGVGPTISAANDAVDYIFLKYNNTNYYGTFAQAFA